MEQGNRNRDVPPKIPLEKFKVDALVKAWIEYREILLKPVWKQPTHEDKKHPNYCLFHRRVAHATPDCYIIRKIYHNKVKNGKIVQEAKYNPSRNHGQVSTSTAVEENPHDSRRGGS